MSADPPPAFSPEERGDSSLPARWLARSVLVVVLLVLIAGVIVAGNLIAGDSLPWLAQPSAAGQDTATASPATSATPDPSPTPDPSATSDPTPADLVEAEDTRLRAMGTVATDGGIVTAAAEGTVVLGARPTPYTIDDLLSSGAAVRDSDTVLTLVRHVVVRTGAVLDLTLPGQTLHLTSTPSGFVSIVAWGGTLVLAGGAESPFTVTSWDPDLSTADTQVYDGRAYVRVRDGSLTATAVDFDALGFWSGRTGGVAITATDSGQSTGVLTQTGHHELHTGLFLSGASNVTVDGATITDSATDGIAITNASHDTSITDTTIDASGGSAVAVDKGSSAVEITGSTLTGSTGFGIDADGSARADGPNPEGYGLDHSSGLAVVSSTVSDNDSGGIRALAFDDAQFTGLTVDARNTGLEIGGPATGVQVSDGAITSTGGDALRLTDAVSDALIAGMTLTGTDGTVTVTDSTARFTGNTIHTNGSGHAISAEGDAVVTATGNTLSGVGAGALSASGDASIAASGNDESGWTFELEAVQWLNRHPMGWLWALLLVVPAIGLPLIAYRRRKHRELRALFEDAVVRFGAAQIESYRQGGAMPVLAAAPEPPGPVAPEIAAITPSSPVTPSTPVTPEAVPVTPEVILPVDQELEEHTTDTPETSAERPSAEPAPEGYAYARFGPDGVLAPEEPPEASSNEAPEGYTYAHVGPDGVLLPPQHPDPAWAPAPGPLTIPAPEPIAAAPAAPRPRTLAELRVGPLADREFATLQDFAVAAVLEAGYPLRTVSSMFRIPSWKLQTWVNQAATYGTYSRDDG